MSFQLNCGRSSITRNTINNTTNITNLGSSPLITGNYNPVIIIGATALNDQPATLDQFNQYVLDLQTFAQPDTTLGFADLDDTYPLGTLSDTRGVTYTAGTPFFLFDTITGGLISGYNPYQLLGPTIGVTGYCAFVQGFNCTSYGSVSAAIGFDCQSNCNGGGLACGAFCRTGGYRGSIALGDGANAVGSHGAIAIGFDTFTLGSSGTGWGAISLGEANTVSGGFGVVGMGLGSTVTGSYGVICGGFYNIASGSDGCICLGANSTASGGYGCIALGYGCTCAGYYGVISMGASCFAHSAGSIAAGLGTSAVSIGAFSNGVGSISQYDCESVQGFLPVATSVGFGLFQEKRFPVFMVPNGHTAQYNVSGVNVSGSTNQYNPTTLQYFNINNIFNDYEGAYGLYGNTGIWFADLKIVGGGSGSYYSARCLFELIITSATAYELVGVTFIYSTFPLSLSLIQSSSTTPPIFETTTEFPSTYNFLGVIDAVEISTNI